ncbi:unnamed protein product [Oikopleura dioica]|uniref:Uncharacterized protein n=1 Tax=Oikopleura dioica TaxID=34765 RepID=E4YRR9_OIKDI|nr:unnamed protein product [Oikopleura dioica]
MTGKRKREASEFKDPQCEKLKKRMQKLLLEPEIAVYGIKNIKLGYSDNVFTGLARCECMKEFVIGTDTRIDLDKRESQGDFEKNMLSIMIIISDGSKTAGYSMIYEPVKNTWER